MDKFDQNILACLTENARQSNAEIARKVGLSRSAVSERIRKMEEKGLILGYRADLTPQESKVAAYFQLYFSQSCCDEVEVIIRPYTEIKSCHSTSGDVDMIIFAEAEGITELNELRNRLEKLPKLTRIVTHTVLEERIRR
ncbi:putative transcriptional regulator, AsnC family [Moritella sp. PE36]|uniref:Lrp/AsnC family transcriptional regulator n=1 Tax=Moritella sp. PE36 TaxID=58051 RepID=UPI0001569695|nr:Lrp/AsnC family transcriptional regulator [Moritella sp. PE36]EDM64865.1 putative transcriptional regulator, AsnC family [Moritella sp. PE36]